MGTGLPALALVRSALADSQLAAHPAVEPPPQPQPQPSAWVSDVCVENLLND